MNSWARKSLKVGALSAGFLLASTAAAHADDTTSNNIGIGNGTQIDAQIQAPINVCGNAIALLGDATAGCAGGAWANHFGELGDLHSSDNFGLLNGTQVRALLQAPVDVCGNAVGIGGSASAWCTGGSWATHKPGDHKGKPGHHGGGYYTQQESAHVEGYGSGSGGSTLTSTQNFGILNGTQVLAPIQIPIDVCGNAIGVLGDATAGCVGGAHATLDSGSLSSAWTGLNFGIGNGTQLMPIIQIPLNVCGNAVGLLGDATASCKGGADAVIGGPDHHPYGAPMKDKPSGQHAGKKHVKGGKKTEELPLVGQLTGLAGGVSGLADGLPGGDLLGGVTGGVTGGMAQADRAGRGAHLLPAPAGKHGDAGSCSLTSSMNAGILNGTQVLLPVQAPIDISGNAVSVVGNASASSTGGASATVTC
jgi:hypothetical protein